MTEETPESFEAPAAEGSADRPDLAKAFKALPAAEKMLAIAAIAVLLGFIIAGGFEVLFKAIWFPTCAFIGSVLCLVIITMDLFGVKVLGHGLKMRVLILLAITPALGFIVDALSDFWAALMLAGSIMMLYVGGKIGTREKIIKPKSED